MTLIALGFVAPVIAYLALYFFVSRRKSSLPYVIAAILIPLLSAATVMGLVFSSSYWREGARVAWTGLSAASGKPLVIGGPRERAVIGWPNGAFAPVLQVTASDAKGGAIEVTGGEAFLYDEKNKKYLNGEALSLGQSQTFGDYTLRVSKGHFPSFWPFQQRRRLEVFNKENELLASVEVKTDKQRVRSLKNLIENYTVVALGSLSRVTEMDDLKDWAEDIHVVTTPDGIVHVLDRQNVAHISGNWPLRLEVIWTNLRLPIQICNVEGRLALNYESPWRLSCPIPPREADKQTTLTVSASPSPGANAFLLPLGHAAEVEGLRQPLLISASPPYRFTENEPRSGAKKEPVWINEPSERCAKKAGNSQIRIDADPYAFDFAIVNDLPGRGKLLGLISLAWLCFLAGVYLSYSKMPETNRWMVYGLAAMVWNFLAFRLLLALRYILDPNSIDTLSVTGLTRAFVGLATIPGLLMLLARLRCDRFEGPVNDDIAGKKRAIYKALAYLLLLLAAFLIEFYMVPHLWADLPERYSSSLGMAYGLLILLTIYLAGYIRFLYEPDPKGWLVKLFVRPWGVLERYLETRQRRFDEQRKQSQKEIRPRRILDLRFWLGAFLCFTIFPLGLAFFDSGEKPIQEIILPIFFYWGPAFLWVAWSLHFTPFAYGRSWGRRLLTIFCYAVPTILFPIMVPLLIGDVGSILTILAIFLPLGCLLIAAPRHKWYFGAAVLLALLLVFMVGGFFYQNLNLLPFNTAKVRLLNFKEGPYIQRYVLWANAIKGGSGLPYQELMNGYQHSWENKAIAHAGGETGLGFGQAPTRRSHIRQDTLQFDSAFSFFITSEYGFFGGMLILLLYVLPLILILLGGRPRVDAGCGIAVLIVSSFLIEGLFHAGMNVGAFPMTGRSLPLITVNSLSDLIRWTLLFSVAVQAIFWRYRGNSRLKDSAVSLITKEAPLASTAPAGRVTNAAARQQPVSEPFWRYAQAVALVLIVPVGLAASVLSSARQVALDPDHLLDEYGYGYILQNVQHLIDERKLTLDQQTLKLNPLTPTDLEQVSEGQFIQQQIARFNALDRGEKIEEMRLKNLQALEAGLLRVRTVEQFQRLLDEIRQQSAFGPRKRKQTLFRLVPVPTVEDEEEEDEKPEAKTTQYRVVPNPDFNVTLNFKAALNKETGPQTRFARDKQETEPPYLLGPAWVMGEWKTVIAADMALPWLVYLREALEEEWKPQPQHLGPEKALARYGMLTLDRKLHNDAMEFVARKGNELHQEILSGNPNTTEYEKKLPPRVGLAIISAVGGETLALGGWPRMTSSDSWQQNAEAGWLPPVRWINQEAPRSIAARYGGDRNFDRAVLMGSSTKPLWASVALAVHPYLDSQLRVRGGKEIEADAFGIAIQPGWEAHASSGWVDFKTYLAASDNRYHVRLGLLALAEGSDQAIKGIGLSSSGKESLDGGGQAWGKYPQFPSSLGFSSNKPGVMLNLHETEMARRFKSMYAVSIKKNEPTTRYSFWTKDETHNVEKAMTDQQPTSLFRWISPEIPQFAFDEFSSENRKGPRDYISLLLGGGTNLWSNVDFAGAFATCITGHPVIAHITNNDAPITLKDRTQFPEIAAKVRPGLAAVMTEGTAFQTLNKTPAGRKALALLKSHPRVEVFAKTGTLKSEEGARNTSRLVLAMIKWKDKSKGVVDTGIVFSVVAERAKVGKATEWLAEFLLAYWPDIEKHI